MTIIFAKSYDPTVKRTMEWLDYFEQKIICTGDARFSIPSFTINSETQNIAIDSDTQKFTINEVRSVWFRSNWLAMKNYFYDATSFKKSKLFKDSAFSYLSNFWFAQKELLIESFKQKKSLGADGQGRYNKPHALLIAGQCGLDIPDTIFTGSKEAIRRFAEKYSQLITKSFDMPFNHYDDNKKFINYTTRLTSEDIEQLPDNFFPTYFQNYIDKEYEIRTFYLDGKCYSSAIISQNNPQTSIDYRKYDYEKMNRNVPYKLPDVVEEKITRFMNECSLKTGSIDIIRSKDKKFVFLEVNPVGQFGAHSDTCNHYLHKRIAEYLKN